MEARGREGGGREAGGRREGGGAPEVFCWRPHGKGPVRPVCLYSAGRRLDMNW